MRTVGEVAVAVIDDMVRPQAPDQLDLGRAAHTGDLGTERLGDLHRERPDTSGGTDDQDLLPRT